MVILNSYFSRLYYLFFLQMEKAALSGRSLPFKHYNLILSIELAFLHLTFLFLAIHAPITVSRVSGLRRVDIHNITALCESLQKRDGNLELPLFFFIY